MQVVSNKISNSIAMVVMCLFTFNVLAAPVVYAQVAFLPEPGTMVTMGGTFNPPVMKGITFHPDNPFKFDFIVDRGDLELSTEALKEESQKIISYFLASLTTPEKEIWVNLSPFEKDRIIPTAFGQTTMGQQLLAQDYLLKQIMATALYPERELGKEFWQKVYGEAQKKFGTTNVPVNTFNKVWIVPNKAKVYENAAMNTVFVVDSSLKVMLEKDYLADNKNKAVEQLGLKRPSTENAAQLSALSTSIIREVLIPALEKEVNEGKNFAQLRQVFQSLILAKWYKDNLKNNVIAKAYVNRNKTSGVRGADQQLNQKIYEQYLKAYRKGVYNFVKEEQDPATKTMVPRKYFSGGIIFDEAMAVEAVTPSPRQFEEITRKAFRKRMFVVGSELEAKAKEDPNATRARATELALEEIADRQPVWSSGLVNALFASKYQLPEPFLITHYIDGIPSQPVFYVFVNDDDSQYMKQQAYFKVQEQAHYYALIQSEHYQRYLHEQPESEEAVKAHVRKQAIRRAKADLILAVSAEDGKIALTRSQEIMLDAWSNDLPTLLYQYTLNKTDEWVEFYAYLREINPEGDLWWKKFMHILKVEAAFHAKLRAEVNRLGDQILKKGLKVPKFEDIPLANNFEHMVAILDKNDEVTANVMQKLMRVRESDSSLPETVATTDDFLSFIDQLKRDVEKDHLLGLNVEWSKVFVEPHFYGVLEVATRPNVEDAIGVLSARKKDLADTITGLNLDIAEEEARQREVGIVSARIKELEDAQKPLVAEGVNKESAKVEPLFALKNRLVTLEGELSAIGNIDEMNNELSAFRGQESELKGSIKNVTSQPAFAVQNQIEAKVAELNELRGKAIAYYADDETRKATLKRRNQLDILTKRFERLVGTVVANQTLKSEVEKLRAQIKILLVKTDAFNGIAPVAEEESEAIVEVADAVERLEEAADATLLATVETEAVVQVSGAVEAIEKAEGLDGTTEVLPVPEVAVVEPEPELATQEDINALVKALEELKTKEITYVDEGKEVRESVTQVRKQLTLLREKLVKLVGKSAVTHSLKGDVEALNNQIGSLQISTTELTGKIAAAEAKKKEIVKVSGEIVELEKKLNVKAITWFTQDMELTALQEKLEEIKAALTDPTVLQEFKNEVALLTDENRITATVSHGVLNQRLATVMEGLSISPDKRLARRNYRKALNALTKEVVGLNKEVQGLAAIYKPLAKEALKIKRQALVALIKRLKKDIDKFEEDVEMGLSGDFKFYADTMAVNPIKQGAQDRKAKKSALDTKVKKYNERKAKFYELLRQLSKVLAAIRAVDQLRTELNELYKEPGIAAAIHAKSSRNPQYVRYAILVGRTIPAAEASYKTAKELMDKLIAAADIQNYKVPPVVEIPEYVAPVIEIPSDEPPESGAGNGGSGEVSSETVAVVETAPTASAPKGFKKKQQAGEPAATSSVATVSTADAPGKRSTGPTTPVTIEVRNKIAADGFTRDMLDDKRFNGNRTMANADTPVFLKSQFMNIFEYEDMPNDLKRKFEEQGAKVFQALVDRKVILDPGKGMATLVVTDILQIMGELKEISPDYWDTYAIIFLQRDDFRPTPKQVRADIRKDNEGVRLTSRLHQAVADKLGALRGKSSGQTTGLPTTTAEGDAALIAVVIADRALARSMQGSIQGTSPTGGIDLEKVKVQSNGAGVKTAFDDPAQLKALLNATGLQSTIWSITPATMPMMNLLLGLKGQDSGVQPPVKSAEHLPAQSHHNLISLFKEHEITVA